MSELARYQARFAEALLSADAPAEVGALFADSDGAARFSVYRNNVAAALANGFVKDYPAVERLVGADFLRGAAVAFARAHPPRRPDLTLYGGDFPAFLAVYPPAADLPYLADVAALDRAWMECLFAADPAPLDVGALDVGALASVDLAAFAPRLSPSARLRASDFPAYSIWEANRADDPPAPIRLDRGGETAFFWRVGGRVRYRAVTTGEAAFLAALDGATPLAAAAARALDADPAFNIEATFAGLLAAGALAAPQPKREYAP